MTPSRLTRCTLVACLTALLVTTTVRRPCADEGIPHDRLIETSVRMDCTMRSGEAAHLKIEVRSILEHGTDAETLRFVYRWWNTDSPHTFRIEARIAEDPRAVEDYQIFWGRLEAGSNTVILPFSALDPVIREHGIAKMYATLYIDTGAASCSVSGVPLLVPLPLYLNFGQ